MFLHTETQDFLSNFKTHGLSQVTQRRKNGTHWKNQIRTTPIARKEERANAKKKKKEGRRIEGRSQV